MPTHTLVELSLKESCKRLLFALKQFLCSLLAIRQTVSSCIQYSVLRKKNLKNATTTETVTETETGKFLKTETKLKLKNLY